MGSKAKIIQFVLGFSTIFLVSTAFLLQSCFLNTTNSVSGDRAIAEGIPHLAVMSSAGCFTCHATWSDYSTDAEWLESLPSEFIPGNADNSDFYKRIIGGVGVSEMPPSGELMSDDDAAVIALWINSMQASE